MPELPEVEVTKRGIAPHIMNKTMMAVTIRQPRLRWLVPIEILQLLPGKRVQAVSRRGKYLLLDCETGWLLIHLGMSGTLRWVMPGQAFLLHDHVELAFSDGALRLNDPRRFGAVLWHAKTQGDIEQHPLLVHLGQEPLMLEGISIGELLFIHTRQRRTSIKQVLLAGDVVVGVGNIYASESLFRAGIRPTTQACRIAKARYIKLGDAISQVLAEAIQKGGSSLRDFVSSDGVAGHFQLDAMVYGRANAPCRRCQTPIKQIKQGQRSTFYCPLCQH